MSKEPNNIDRLIREKLEGFEMTPPASVWDSTSSALSTGKRKRFFLWLALGVLGAILLAVGTYFLVADDESSGELMALDSSKTEQLRASEVDNSTSNANSASRNQVDQSDGNIHDNEVAVSRTELNGQSTSDGSAQKMNTSLGSSLGGTNVSSGDGKSKVNRSEFEGQTNKTGQSTSKRSGTGNSLSGNSDDSKSLSTSGSSRKTGASDGDNTSVTRGDEKENGELSDSGARSSTDDSEQLDGLPLKPVLPFYQPKGILVVSEEEELPMVKSPVWKAFSLEASVGMSKFRNVPSSKLTDPLIIAALNDAASNQFSLDAQFGVNYHFTDRFSFGSGIHYNASRENYQYDSEQIVTYTVVDSVTFTVDTATFDTTYTTHTSVYDSSVVSSTIGVNTYRIFTLPFQFNWTQPLSPRSALEFSVGGAVSLFGRNTGVVLPDTSNFAIDAQEGYHTSGMLSVGGSVKYLYRFGNHHSVYVEPWIQLGVTNQSTPALNYESLRRRYGIRVGYRFYF